MQRRFGSLQTVLVVFREGPVQPGAGQQVIAADLLRQLQDCFRAGKHRGRGGHPLHHVGVISQ